MLTQSARPLTFSQVAGQKIPVALLRSIVKNPSTAPKSIILSGPFGCSKTTNARIFARALNCEHPLPNGDPCLHCSSCLTKLDESPFYSEYDASQLKLDTVRQLTETWFSTLKNGWTVRVLDEAHVLSKQVQSALLKVTEEVPDRTFIIWCTTELDKVLPTIRSRSLEIKITTVSYQDMYDNLVSVADSNSIPVTPQVLDRIIKVSKGHMRNAHMELDKYSILGQDAYLSLFTSSYDVIDSYFLALAQHNQTKVFQSIDALLQYPLATIKDDFKGYILDLTKSLISSPTPLVKLLGSSTLKLIKLTLSDWFIQCFSSDVELQTGLLCLYQIMSETSNPSKPIVKASVNARR